VNRQSDLYYLYNKRKTGELFFPKGCGGGYSFNKKGPAPYADPLHFT